MRWFMLMVCVLACAMLAGCGSEDTTCTSNDDCVEGFLCGQESECIEKESVWIVTEKLPAAIVEAEYEFTLEAADGISPYSWSLLEKPDWMSIHEHTGTLSGTPEQIATGVSVKVRVEDSTTGRDSWDEVELSIDATICGEGQTTACYQPSNDKCLEGLKHCSGGKWGDCVNASFSTNKEHCGPDCEPCDEQVTDSCDRGACACGDGAPCTGDDSCCDADCVDLETSLKNCGVCGRSCEEVLQNVVDPRCQTSVCVYGACLDGFFDCNDNEYDGCETALGAANCGECGRDCATQVQHATEVLCVDTAGTYNCDYQGNGSVGEGCDFGFLDCDGDRTNGCETPANSQDHCGTCGNVCDAKCELHPDGDRYYCVCSEDSDCGGTRQCCNGTCFDQYDPAHCGNCFNDCTQVAGNVVSALCNQGVCDYTECLPLYMDCDSDRSNGCETPMSDLNCGQCGFSCGTNAHCVDGSCACVTHRGNCDDDWDNGCETNLVVTIDHCGSCEINCNIQVQNALEISCEASLCTYNRCVIDWGECDDDLSNGCETNLYNDDQNCGECHLICELVNGTNYCASGVCHPTCMSGWGDCDAKPPNGCETSTVANIDHCGACFNNCMDNIQNASGAVCSSSACDYSICSSNYANCDNDRTNGCEAHLPTDTEHCGSCGIDCNTDVVHASSILCSSGLCNYGSCDANYGDCDDDRTNGCEANLRFDAENCGECGNKCTAPNIICDIGICKRPL